MIAVKRIIFCIAALCLAGGGLAAQADAEPPRWVLVDSNQQTLFVMAGNHVLEEFPGVSFGRGGVSESRQSGDGRTPIGTFHIAWVNPQSQYHLFFGLDYPRVEHVERAFEQHLIDFDTYYRIRKALYRGELPPQDTPLGGHIGIHGVGIGSEWMHKAANWTQGCIALTDQQIERLARWITLGTRVVIQ